MLDYPEHRFHFGPSTIAFPIERLVLPTQLATGRPLARYWPRLAFRLHLGLAFLTDLRPIPVNLLLSGQTFLHNRRIMDLRRSPPRRVHEAVPIRTPWAFRPKGHGWPFFVDFISGSRSPALFFVDRGAQIIVASTIGPVWMTRPCALR